MFSNLIMLTTGVIVVSFDILFVYCSLVVASMADNEYY